MVNHGRPRPLACVQKLRAACARPVGEVQSLALAAAVPRLVSEPAGGVHLRKTFARRLHNLRIDQAAACHGASLRTEPVWPGEPGAVERSF